MNPPRSKPWYESKTVWLNIIGFLVIVLGGLNNQPWVEANPGLASAIAAALPVLNNLLRLFSTATPIRGTGSGSNID